MANRYVEYITQSQDRESPTYEAAGLARKLVTEDPEKGVNLTLGELDKSPLPEDLNEWAGRALNILKGDRPDKNFYALAPEIVDGQRNYPPAEGTPQFRRVAAFSFANENKMENITEDDVAVSSGGKGVLCGIGKMFKPGDEVLVSAPGWPSNYDFWNSGMKLIELDTHGRGLMKPEELRQALDDHPNLKAVLINDPCNPTGARYPSEEREQIMEVLNEARSRQKGNKILAIMDDPYGALNYNGASMERSLAEKKLFNDGGMVVVNSVSKVYAAPDLRVGYAVSKNQDVIKGIKVYNSNHASATLDGQNKAQLMLLFGGDFKEATKARLEKRAKFMMENINKIDGLHMDPPQGAIYGWINTEGLKGKLLPDGTPITDPKQVPKFFRDMARVGTVDGVPFFAPTKDPSETLKENGWHVRVVLTRDKKLEQAVGQIENAISQLRDAPSRSNGKVAGGGGGSVWHR